MATRTRLPAEQQEPHRPMISVKFSAPSPKFWERQGAILACFLVGFVAWYLGASLISLIVELYYRILGLGDPHTLTDNFAKGKILAPWPNWMAKGPVIMVLVGYPIVFITDVFVCALRGLTQKHFGARS